MSDTCVIIPGRLTRALSYPVCASAFIAFPKTRHRLKPTYKKTLFRRNVSTPRSGVPAPSCVWSAPRRLLQPAHPAKHKTQQPKTNDDTIITSLVRRPAGPGGEKNRQHMQHKHRGSQTPRSCSTWTPSPAFPLRTAFAVHTGAARFSGSPCAGCPRAYPASRARRPFPSSAGRKRLAAHPKKSQVAREEGSGVEEGSAAGGQTLLCPLLS